MNEYDFTKKDIVEQLNNVGLTHGDNIFIHSNIGFFGKLKNGNNKESYCQIFKEAIFDVIGDEGTLVVPTFSYSFFNKESFHIEKSKSVCGIFSEYIRNDKDSLRSADPNFSIAAIGKNAKFFTENPPTYSFGINSFWERLLKVNGKICNFNFDSGSTFIHYVEKLLNVPYRYDKGFIGICVNGDKTEECTFYHFVWDMSKPEHHPEFVKFDKKAREKGFLKVANLGKGQIVCISSSKVLELIKEEIKINPALLIKGDKVNL